MAANFLGGIWNMTWKGRIDKRTADARWQQGAQWCIAIAGLIFWLLNEIDVLVVPTYFKVTAFIVVVGSIVILGAFKKYNQSDIRMDRKQKVKELLRDFFALSVGSEISLPEMDEETERDLFDRLWESADYAGYKFDAERFIGENLNFIKLKRLPDDAVQKTQL